MVSCGLVFIMTPGLAFFYGGLVAKRNMISTIAYCFITYALISILWCLIGFTLTFGENNNIIGDLSFGALSSLNSDPMLNYGKTIPSYVFVFF